MYISIYMYVYIYIYTYIYIYMYRRNGDWRQATALHKAAQHGFMDVIEALVSMGADVHQVAASFPASSCVLLRLAVCGCVVQYVTVCCRCPSGVAMCCSMLQCVGGVDAVPLFSVSHDAHIKWSCHVYECIVSHI